MIDPHAFLVKDTLGNGTAVTIRAAHPDDGDRLRAAFRNLDPESIYTRFFQYKKDLTDEEVKRATDADFEHTVVLLVTTIVDGKEIVIGGASYAVLGTAGAGRAAEVAFIVEEDYQGLGIASRLLRHLAVIAREKGITRFEADVLPGNHAMLSVFSRIGLPRKERREDGIVHITISLEGSSP